MFIMSYYVEVLKYGRVTKQHTVQATNLEEAKRKVRTLLNPGQKARIECEHYVIGDMR